MTLVCSRPRIFPAPWESEPAPHGLSRSPKVHGELLTSDSETTPAELSAGPSEHFIFGHFAAAEQNESFTGSVVVVFTFLQTPSCVHLKKPWQFRTTTREHKCLHRSVECSCQSAPFVVCLRGRHATKMGRPLKYPEGPLRGAARSAGWKPT